MEEEYCAKCPHRGNGKFKAKIKKNTDIFVVGDAPAPLDYQFSSFISPANKVVSSMILEEKMVHHRGEELQITFGFAYQCIPASHPDAASMIRCKPEIQSQIKQSQAKVLILLGANACRAVGIKGNISELRGKVFTITIGGHELKAVPLFRSQTIFDCPGLLKVVRADIRRAFQLLDGQAPAPTTNLQTPKDYDNVVKLLDGLKQQIDNTVDMFSLAVDVETTSLTPRPGEKTIAVSLSWADNQGAAFLLDHREAVYTAKQRADIGNRLEKILSSPNMVLWGANGKFDYKWLKFLYGFKMSFFGWDTQIAEHCLEEDKQGSYSLKDLTGYYLPAFGGYEDELEKAKEEIKARRAKEAKEAKETALRQFVDSWVTLSETQRSEMLDRWISGRHILITEKDKLVKVRYAKLVNGTKIAKKYVADVQRMVDRLPPEELGIDGLQQDVPEVTFEDVCPDMLLKYAAMDALVTREIAQKQMERMCSEKGDYTWDTFQAFQDLSMPLSKEIAEMEFIGIRMDRGMLHSYMQTLDVTIQQLEDALYQEAGRKFNLSPGSQDFKKVLFQEKGYRPIAFTETEQPKVDEKSLKKMRRGEDPFLDNLVTHRKLSKARSTFLANWDTMSAFDGRLHPSFNQTGTATFRLSSSNPNLQNVPFALKEADMNLKALFVPDCEEYELYDLDISNAEMRVLTAYSEDEALIQAFSSGQDIHCLTAAGISDYSYEELLANKEDKTSDHYLKRQIAKKLNFGSVYGISAHGLKRDFQTELGLKMTKTQAQEYLDKFMDTYPGVARYIQNTKRYVLKNKYVSTLTGRKRCFPLLHYTRDKTEMASIFRQAVNARIQSTSADIVNSNLVDLAEAIKPLGGRVLLTVHDSILFQLPKGTPGVRKLLDEVFIHRTRERFPWLPVDWKYDVARGPSYGECTEEV